MVANNPDRVLKHKRAYSPIANNTSLIFMFRSLIKIYKIIGDIIRAFAKGWPNNALALNDHDSNKSILDISCFMKKFDYDVPIWQLNN